MGILLNGAFFALVVTLYLVGIGALGPISAIACYTILGTCAVFAQAGVLNILQPDDHDLRNSA